jgi:23S rRNA (cytidine1920-2'-O)/16S rRNA (cytidine1409-2'-O)-methyltransferase
LTPAAREEVTGQIMVRRVQRLDAELTRRGLARSRAHAVDLIEAGRVEVRGTIAHKPATGVGADTPLRVLPATTEPDFVSRGGHKLAGALAALPDFEVAGRRCLDAGASTGGFTDVLLRSGAREVVAVDVGYGQLAWSLRTDSRVDVRDRVNVRGLTPEFIGGLVDVTVADLSFISLRQVLPALTACTDPGGDVLPMVKPQFEVGRERLGKGGVVRDLALRAQAVCEVAQCGRELGWHPRAAVPSPLPGPSGNVEFFLWLRRAEQPQLSDDDITAIVTAASEAP